jgi:uncharacterized protein YqcC (DUF446 family)
MAESNTGRECPHQSGADSLAAESESQRGLNPSTHPQPDRSTNAGADDNMQTAAVAFASAGQSPFHGGSMIFVARDPRIKPVSGRELLWLAGGLMLLAFVLLVPVMHWVGGFGLQRSLGLAALVAGGVGGTLLLMRVAMTAGDWLVDRAMDGVGRLWRRAFPRFSAPQRAQRLAELRVLLDQVESELHRLGWWADDPPPLRERYLSGELRTYLDAPSFELWLQCVFLPNAREAVANDSLPGSSSVGVMAMRQYDYHSEVPEAFPLMRLLQRFDQGANDLVGHDPLAP